MNNTDLMNVFALMEPSSGKDSIPKAVVDRHIDDRLTRGKTRKGAKHIHGKVFKSVKYLMLTPAQYRNSHFARTVKGVPTNGYPRYY